jgi:hypothetical protein
MVGRKGNGEVGIGKSVLSETNPQAIPTNANMSPNPTTQEFIIESSGTSIIRKYNHEIKRTIDNRVWIDNILQN